LSVYTRHVQCAQWKTSSYPKCDVTVLYSLRPYDTHRHNNVNPDPQSVTSFMDDPYVHIYKDLVRGFSGQNPFEFMPYS